MERITVLASLAGKFGPQLKDAKGYLSFGKFYKGDTAFAEGTQLDADLFVTAKGSRYINSLSVVGSTAEVHPAPKFKGFKKVKEKSVADVEPKVRDFDKENRGKVKSLFLEAMLSNPNVTVCAEDVDKLNSPAIQEALNKLVESVF